ncbi:MAG: cell division protein FtsZ, partial [Archaeoglobaceae archaeon]
VHISGGNDLTLKEAEEIIRNLTFELDDNANVIWGARISKEFEGFVRVVAIMTGIKHKDIVGCTEYENLSEEPRVRGLKEVGERRVEKVKKSVYIDTL